MSIERMGPVCAALLFAALLLALPQANVARAEGNAEVGAVMEQLSKLSYGINYVRSFGAWQEDGQQGNYRLVLLESSRDFVHSLLFLQWLQHDLVDGKRVSERVIHTAPVNEINLPMVYRITEPKVGEGEHVVIEVMAVNQYTKRMQGFIVVPAGVGKYTLSETSASGAKPVAGDLAEISQQVTVMPPEFEHYLRPTF